MITSFGFHIIIPTLTTYLDRDKKALRKAIFLGSLCPLVVYVLWEFLVLGIVPIEGEVSLNTAWNAGSSGATPLAQIMQSSWIGNLAKIFSFLAIITSFLGVSLSLTDFLTDGLHIKRFGFNREISSFLTFFPPLFFVYIYPNGFIVALKFAGIFVTILLCIFPALMVLRLPSYRKIKKRILTFLVLILSFVIIALELLV